MSIERAQAIAEAASRGLPLASVTVNTFGVGIARYEFFDSPQQPSISARYRKAGAHTVRFAVDGAQTTMDVYFMERVNE